MQNIKQAIEDIRQGKMIIVTDDECRENEGDLIIAAEKVTPAAINFMIKQAGGLICLAMTGEKIDQLQLDFMNPHRVQDDMSTPFTMSIDAKQGITTGISAVERAHTVLTAINPHAQPADLIRPGHVFPLRARDNGVLERPGHTEAAVDLARLAGLQPGGVICEIIGEDGTMLRGKALKQYAVQYGLTLISIQDLITYRLQHEPVSLPQQSDRTSRMQKTADCQLQTRAGTFQLHIFRDKLTQLEHSVLVMGDVAMTKRPLVRLHSSCVTGDIFASKHCDCGVQLNNAMHKIAEENCGVILYLNQEGRGIGLTNKILTYALQEQGYNTVSANLALGFPADARDYTIAADMLQQLGVSDMRLMTNNPEKLRVLSELMGTTIERVSHQMVESENCKAYLQTKRDYLGHFLNLADTNH
ncbi:MAG: 3,4-dihydroxy-2-butanone-4-phosphate synthase [Gammaproteobacteria bacterium]